MSMRPYIRSAEKDIQKTVRIVGRLGMKIVIHPEPWRRRRTFRNRIEERVRDQFHFTHRLRLP